MTSVIVMNLKEIRTEYNLSQFEAADITGVPVRTYRRYESDERYGSKLKRRSLIEILKERCEITEEKGLLTIETIKDKITSLLETEYKNKVDFCYLFGSYAKGQAKDGSDVDLYVSTSLTGLAFVGLIENMRRTLHKKVDLIRTSELINNAELMNEIMKDGIKIYG